MADVKVLVIDRSKWLRGEKDGRLVRPRDGKMCCLGFYGVACGIMPADMFDQGTPEEDERKEWPTWLVLHDDETDRRRDTMPCTELVTTNDEVRMSDADREKDIAAVFARHGVEVRFVDGSEQPRAAPSSPPDPSTEIR